MMFAHAIAADSHLRRASRYLLLTALCAVGGLGFEQTTLAQQLTQILEDCSAAIGQVAQAASHSDLVNYSSRLGRTAPYAQRMCAAGRAGLTQGEAAQYCTKVRGWVKSMVEDGEPDKQGYRVQVLAPVITAACGVY